MSASDSGSADAGPVLSRVQLERLVADDELTGRTLIGFSAPSVGLRGVDLDGVTMERLNLAEADADEARLEHATLKQVDGRKSRWQGGLWNRVQLRESDFTQVDLTRAHILRCDLGPGRMGRAQLVGARVQDTAFKECELYYANLTKAVLLRVQFSGYESGIVSLSHVDFTDAALFDVDFQRANLRGAVFKNAMLVRCNLSGANLCDADLRGARLVGCEHRGVDLDGATTS